MAGASGKTAPAKTAPQGQTSASKPFRDDCMKPLENLFSFLRKNELPDIIETSVLFQVHEDLRLIRKWTDLRVVKGSTKFYLAGKAPIAFDSVFPGRKNPDANGEDRTQVVMPIPTSEMLSPRKLKELCQECVHPETGKHLRCMTIAIVDEDTTTAYYRIFNSFDEIVHPQWKQKKKRPKNEDKTEGTEEREGDVNMKVNSESESGASDSDSA